MFLFVDERFENKVAVIPGAASGIGAATARLFAREGARVAMAFGFERHGLNQIIAVAPRANTPSIRVMERLGMTADPGEDFDHPALTDHPAIQRCALHRLDRAAFEATP